MGFDLDAVPFLAASRSGTRVGTPRLVVIHAMANAGGIRQGAARACAQWFANPDCRYQAHLSIDPREVWRSVALTREAYHVGVANMYGGNPSVGIELAGYGDDRDDWTTADGHDEVVLAARVARAVADRFGIPWRWLTDDELRRGEPGISDHATCARVLGGSDHTDPGRKFPREAFMALGAGLSAPTADPPPVSAPQEDDDMTIFVRGENRAQVIQCSGSMVPLVLVPSEDYLADIAYVIRTTGGRVVGDGGAEGFVDQVGVPVRVVSDRFADELAAQLKG